MPRLVAFHIRFTQAISLVPNHYHASFRRPIPMRRLALGKRGACSSQAVIGLLSSLMISISHQLYDPESAPSSRSRNLFPHIYTLRKCIKGSHHSRSANFSKAFLPTISLTLCPQLLLQAARSSSLDRIPSASCRVVWWSRVRGILLFRAHQAALSSSGMRASADELSAWEALAVSLVGCVRWLDRCPYSS